jgi:RNA polymerase sigma-70 factor (ECF subfamily)
MFKSFLKRMLPLASGVERPIDSGSAHTDNSLLVSRIIAGDTDAEAELVDWFKVAVFHIVANIARNESLAEDFSQETFITIIRKIRNGDVEHPESLPSFVAKVARYHAIEQMRKLRRRNLSEDLEQAEQLPDPSPNRLDELQTSEELHEIRELIQQLNPRYRILLLRFYIHEEPKEVICADLGLTPKQFDNVLHRARNSYKELYLKRKGLVKKDRRR